MVGQNITASLAGSVGQPDEYVESRLNALNDGALAGKAAHSGCRAKTLLKLPLPTADKPTCLVWFSTLRSFSMPTTRRVNNLLAFLH